ncbi:MAG: hypothetical protein JHC88_19150 [Niveispirillum sp.]|jgi:hypothetical protein|nr:hypothetical protein [Niveispirillum sp.]
MPRYSVLDRNLSASIQAALDEGDRTGPVPVSDVRAILTALEQEWEAEALVNARVDRLSHLDTPPARNG